MNQFSALIRHLPEIEEALLQKGETVPRPNYDDDNSEHNKRKEVKGEDARNSSSTVEKKNIEATSEEDEDEN
jgi:hypothetical protein